MQTSRGALVLGVPASGLCLAPLCHLWMDGQAEQQLMVPGVQDLPEASLHAQEVLEAIGCCG